MTGKISPKGSITSRGMISGSAVMNDEPAEGQSNIPVTIESFEYVGQPTDTAITVVDNDLKTIAVDVPNLPKKQNLGYIIIDDYLLNPDHGQMPEAELAELSSYVTNKISLKTQIYYLSLSNENILVYFCTSRNVTKNQITVERATGEFQVESIASHDDHSKLYNLDYLNSGHTGFAGIEFGTTAHWNSKPNYKPVSGMIIVYTDYKIDKLGRDVPGIKIGDGNAYLINKPFIGEDVAEILAAHILDTTAHITEEERQRWNNKLNCVAPEAGSDLLVFNRN